jgi:hypothetical protein
LYVKKTPAFPPLILSKPLVIYSPYTAMSFHKHQISFLIICLCMMVFSCQKDKDILDRFLPGTASKGILTTVISKYQGSISKDSIFWFQDASGRVDSAYRYDSVAGKRKKIFHVDRSTPGMIRIDDGDEGLVSARILFNVKNQPYKVIFFNRITQKRAANSYNFKYGNSISPNGLESYMDSIYSTQTLETYGYMATSDYKYPIDSFEKLSAQMGVFVSGDYIFNTQRGADLSSFSFVPFVSLVVTSNLADNYPSSMHYNVFDTYIWGEVMRPWLPKHVILGFYSEQFYPTTQPVRYYGYTANVSPGKIIYSDGYLTITNYYP